MRLISLTIHSLSPEDGLFLVESIEIFLVYISPSSTAGIVTSNNCFVRRAARSHERVHCLARVDSPANMYTILTDGNLLRSDSNNIVQS